ncbi:MAG: heavy metal translocating P-type ATPase metal-binding domain-containing protein, partial [Opitutaceae bacterium]|nr:heavy metal translocating P-type ATPase metal-binding domain-containing protein [Opitutaceae bacterium]
MPAVALTASAASGTPANGQDATRSRAKPICRHCGAPLPDTATVATGFCCAGCAYVHRLVHEHGLDGYYRIKDPLTAPADSAVFQPRDFSWLTAAQLQAEQSAGAGVPALMLEVQGISCAGCVWLIERLFQQLPGARDIIVNAQLGQLQLRWLPGKFDATGFAHKLQTFGYLLGPAGADTGEPESRALVRRIGLCTAFAMNVMLFTLPVYFGMERDFAYARLFGTLSLAFGTLSLLAGGGYFLGRAVQALRAGTVHIDLPISIGILGAYLGSLYGWLTEQEAFVYFDFVSGFILLMLVGRWAQVTAVERNRRRLLAQQPKPRRVALHDGRTIPPEELQTGMGFVLVSGQTLPVESLLESGPGSFSLASINGEAEPQIFQTGQRVPAGAVCLTQTGARFSALQPWAESLLAELLRPAARPSERHRFLERIIRGYLIGIIVIATVAGLGWWLGTGDLLRTWSVVTAVLVVSCPCAIGLAFPLADEMATVALRRRGVFVREEDLWSRLGRVRRLVFDKTGTLTLETPVLRNPESVTALDAPARTALHVLVRDNPHPASQCLLESLLAAGPVPVDNASAISDLSVAVRETVGAGVEFGSWALGRAGWRDAAAQDDATVLTHAGQIIARFYFTDSLRPDAAAEVAALAARGLGAHILSGDAPAKVATLGRQLGLPAAHCLGGCSPQDKAAWFSRPENADALMLGDGANDSLAFDRALCRGTPVIHRGVLEQKADFYYLGRG